jgi:hypothetical protein
MVCTGPEIYPPISLWVQIPLAPSSRIGVRGQVFGVRAAILKKNCQNPFLQFFTQLSLAFGLKTKENDTIIFGLEPKVLIKKTEEIKAIDKENFLGNKKTSFCWSGSRVGKREREPIIFYLPVESMR